MKWQRTRPRYDTSMLIYMYMYIWTVKACGGWCCVLNKIEGCDRFLTILTMIAGMFRVSCNNDSRVYNQPLIGKKGQRSWSQKRFERAVKIEPTNIRVLLILTGKKSKVFTTYWVGLWTGIVLSNTWVFVLVNCFGVFRGPGSRNTPSPVEFGCQWTDSPTCPRRTSSSCRIRSLLCN